MSGVLVQAQPIPSYSAAAPTDVDSFGRDFADRIAANDSIASCAVTATPNNVLTLGTPQIIGTAIWVAAIVPSSASVSSVKLTFTATLASGTVLNRSGIVLISAL